MVQWINEKKIKPRLKPIDKDTNLGTIETPNDVVNQSK